MGFPYDQMAFKAERNTELETQPWPPCDNLRMLTKLLNYPEIVRTLFSRTKFDINFQDEFNETVLHNAARRQTYDIKLLLRMVHSLISRMNLDGLLRMIVENSDDHEGLATITPTRDGTLDSE